MRKLVLSIGLAIALAAPAPAQAAVPKLVARGTPIGNPALAGKSVYFAQQGVARQVVVERVSGGRTRIVGRLGKGAIPVRVDASAAGYAVLWEVFGAPGSGIVDSTLSAGPPGGPPAIVARGCPGREPPRTIMAVDGNRLAYVDFDCDPTTSHGGVIVRDLRTRAEVARLPAFGNSVAIAGDLVAFQDLSNYETIDVFDVAAKRLVRTLTVPGLRNLAVQDDGGLAAVAASDFDRDCSGRIGVSPPGSDFLSSLDECGADTILAIANDHVVEDLGTALKVWGGAAFARHESGDAWVDSFDLEGDRLLFATRGCSFDTGSIWIADVRGSPIRSPRATHCKASLGAGPYTVDERGVVRVRTSCPTGCKAAVEFERGLGVENFESRHGAAKSVPVQLRDPDALFAGRSTIRLALKVTVYEPDGGTVVTDKRVVTLERGR